MPNRVAQLRAEIEATHPGARLAHRGEAGFSMRLPSGVEEHRYTTGPWHWKQPDDTNWQEIDTDLESRPHIKWSRGVKSARFDTLVAEDGSRRFIPRRWLPDEWVEFGPLQWKAAINWTTPALGTGELRGEDGARGAGNNRLGFDRPTHAFEVGFNGRGCRTSLVLKSAAVARPLRWKVTLNGLEWKDGALVSLRDGERVGFIRPPSWTDASENPDSHPIPWVYEDGCFTLSPDFTAAVFPVVVDPDYAIVAGGDDGYVYDTYSLFNSNQTSGYIGDNGGATYKTHAWFRFAAIAASQGQDCTAATLTVRAASARTTDINTKLYGVDEADHAAPTDKATWATDHGIHTTAAVDWDITDDWAAGTVATSPDISAILDELFAIGAWTTGNDVGIHWDDDGSASNYYRYWASFENTTYTEPILSLTLAAGGETITCAGAAVSATTSAAALKIRHDLTGAATSGSTGAAALKLAHEITGAAVSATATAAALTAEQTISLAGAATSGTATAASLKLAHELVSWDLISSATTTAGALKVVHELAGAAVSATVTAAALTAEQTIAISGAAVSATATVAALKIVHEITGAATSATVTAAVLDDYKRLTGAAASATTTASALKVVHETTGAAVSATTTAATLSAEQTIGLTGAAVSATVTAGTLDLTHRMTGAATDTTVTTAALKVTHELAGAAASTTVTAASLITSQIHSLEGAAVSASTVAAALNVGQRLAGAAVGTTTVAAALKVVHELAGAAVSTTTVTAALEAGGVKTLAGAAVSATTAAGSLDLTHWLTAAALDATTTLAWLNVLTAGPFTATLTTTLLNTATLVESLTATASNTEQEAGQATLVLTPAH